VTVLGVLRVLGVLALALVGLGIPVNTPVDGAALAMLVVALAAGTVRAGRRRWGLALVAAVVLTGARMALPLPMIEEGENVFVYSGPGGAFERALPREVFGALRDGFVARYPHGVAAQAADTAYAFSGDSVFQTPRYSRILHGLSFTSVAALRLGAVNSWNYNVYRPEHGLIRTDLPYFIRLDLPITLVGGRLCWRGDLFWPTPGDGFERISHDQTGCRTLEATMPVSLFAMDIDPRRPLAMTLEPPVSVTAVTGLALVLGLAAVLVVGGLLVRVNRHNLPLPTLAMIATLVTAFVISGEHRSGFLWDIRSGFSILEGGNDGLTYASFAHDMVQAALHGNWGEALRGHEDAFYFMPGKRYLDALQLVLFGETIYGVLLFTGLFPLLLLAVMRVLLPERWAVGLFLIFLITPFLETYGFWNFYYVRLALRGFGEPFGYGFFLAALALILSRLSLSPPPEAGSPKPADKQDDLTPWFLAGLALAGAVAVRPNLAPGTAVLLTIAAGWLLYYRRLGTAATLSIGFAPILLLPLHNWIYGGVFVPFTTAADISENLVATPSDYRNAILPLLTLEWQNPVLIRVGHKIAAWVAPYEIWRQIAVIAAVLAVFGRSIPLSLRTLALIVLAQHAVLLFYNSGGRYGHLVWSLSFLILVSLARLTAIKSWAPGENSLWRGLRTS
jgi:hypothetical protein